MPQGSGANKSKGNKKGRKPAHQNTFAFKHNPKSKTTDKILNSANVHVCRRCHEKIEWRKNYRKYKPLTQPAKCNLCQKRNIKAAYHTICTDCTTSDKAKKRLLNEKASSSVEPIVEGGVEITATPSTSDEITKDVSEMRRVCAMCTKEYAMRNEDDEDPADALALETGHMRLRDRRALERKLARKEEEAKKAKQAAKDARRAARIAAKGITRNENNDDEEDSESDIDLPEGDDEEDDEEDPFLKAVGGSDKLATGEEYQRRVLERAEEQSKES